MPTLKSKQFKPNASAEAQFSKALRKVAANAAHVVEVHVEGATIYDEESMIKVLNEYSKKLRPWAARQASKMIERVAKKNKTAWRNHSKQMHVAMQTHVAKAETGRKAAELLQEQIDLIQSIPLRAAERAQKLAQEAFFNGTRSSEIAAELQRTGKVSENDAERIARTEVARSNSVITQVRAQAAGSKQYVWRTSGDDAVRPAHKEMNGEVCSWDKPPHLEDGTVGHPGTFPNCRCYPEPFFPDN